MPRTVQWASGHREVGNSTAAGMITAACCIHSLAGVNLRSTNSTNKIEYDEAAGKPKDSAKDADAMDSGKDDLGNEGYVLQQRAASLSHALDCVVAGRWMQQDQAYCALWSLTRAFCLTCVSLAPCDFCLTCVSHLHLQRRWRHRFWVLPPVLEVAGA